MWLKLIIYVIFVDCVIKLCVNEKKNEFDLGRGNPKNMWNFIPVLLV